MRIVVVTLFLEHPHPVALDSPATTKVGPSKLCAGSNAKRSGRLAALPACAPDDVVAVLLAAMALVVNRQQIAGFIVFIPRRDDGRHTLLPVR